jgi:hypothetical protein
MWDKSLQHWLLPERIDFLNQRSGQPSAKDLFKARSAEEKTWLEQALLRHQYKDKFPTWCQNPHVFLPPSLHLQQATAEPVTQFKSTLVRGDSYSDLTMGMGMDLWGMRHSFARFMGAEPRPELAAITAYNLEALGVQAQVLTQRAEDVYRAIPVGTTVGLDPDRRPGIGGSKGDFSLHLPNPIPLWNELRSKGHQILLKAAPLTDITALQRQLPGASHLWIIAWKNEVRELLWANLEPGNPLQITTIRLDSAQVAFQWDETRRNHKPPVSPPQDWIMDPYPEIHKAGAYAELCERFGLSALGTDTRLFTGQHPDPQFPGLIYRFNGWASKATDFPLGARIISRNHPQSPEALRKAWKLKENHQFLLAAITNYEGSKKYLSGALYHPEG